MASIFANIFSPKGHNSNDGVNKDPSLSPPIENKEAGGSDPNNITTTNEPSSASPFDKFKDLWENKVDDKASPAFDPNNALALKPEDIRKITSQMDFSSSLGKENLAKIAAGGEEAVAAFQASLNSFGQELLAQALLGAGKLTENGLAKASGHVDTRIADMVKRQQVNSLVDATNPAFRDPAVAPILDAIKIRLQEKNPTSSPEEIAAAAKEYMTSMAGLFNPKVGTEDASKSKKDVDWEKFFNS